jgi:hypothetical protein
VCGNNNHNNGKLITIVEQHRTSLRRTPRVPFLMYGLLSLCFGLAMYLPGVLLVVPRYLMGLNAILLPINEWIVWYSGVPIMVGFVLALVDFCFCSESSAGRTVCGWTLSLIEG